MIKTIFNKLFYFLRRDFLIFISYKFDILSRFIFLMVIVIGFFYLIYSNADEEFFTINNKEYFLKYILGIIYFDFIFSMMNIFSKEIRQAQMLGIFEILFLTRTPFYFILFYSSALTFIRALIRSIFFILLGIIFFNVEILFKEMLFMYGILFLSLVPFVSIGIFSGLIILFYKKGNPINILITLFSIFTSGAFFSKDILPKSLNSIAEFHPIDDAITLTLQYFKNQNLIVNNEYLGNLFFIGIGMMVFASFLLYYSIRFAKRNGNLNFY